ncbi:MAG: GDP-L-fucose synthase [Proteobacteria bacterium]|nr:GDP-L-fucose synthase [Pseudomonadota bacterium]MBU1060655.1 GDP-L-fucose synthase [Pseudomonadota bacterium]
MKLDSKIYVAGHRGLVGSAIIRVLEKNGYTNFVLRTHKELELTEQDAVRAFFARERPEYVFMAAAKVGGIGANSAYPAAFIYDNLSVQQNVIHQAWKTGVNRLLFLGSSCIYPRDCRQPMKEEYLLTGPLEITNRSYAVAKIAGIEMCRAYNEQYGTRYLSVMPTNLFGPGDNYDLENSHVLPALIRKMHEAKIQGARKAIVWGSGAPRREFLYSDDMAEACVYLMNLPDNKFTGLLNSSVRSVASPPPLINIGCGEDITIRELANMVRQLIGFTGDIGWDTTKPDGTPRKLLDVEKLFSLGWRPRISLTEGIQQAYRDFLRNSPKGN